MATTEGTQAYFEKLGTDRIPQHAIRTFGKTGWRVSGIGFGGYRIHHNSAEHGKALRHALLNGINLIDTSSNYGDGGSEMLIGNLLQQMFERGELDRDEVVVVSKAGYVQGQNMALAQQQESAGTPFPDMVRYTDSCWHCIHPEFLQDQLSRTLERLHLSHLDVYLLHNPEYFLTQSKKTNGRSRQQIEDAYYGRIRLAFEWMEQKVAEGKIKAYGVSSNTLPAPAEEPEFTSLEKLLEQARKVSQKHSFQVIQFPFNLLESGAATETNQASGESTLLQLAREQGLATMVNRPLNAAFGNSMIRLANFRETEPRSITETFHKKLTTLQRLEKQYRDEFIGKIKVDIPKEKLEKLFALSRQLDNALSYFQDWEQWDHVRQNLLFPQTMNSLSYLSQGISGDAWEKWRDAYATMAIAFFEAISRKYENQAQERSIKFSGKLKSLNGDLATSPSLAQQALRVLVSTPGVDCVLLGMRQVGYVEDALAALKSDPIPEAVDLLIDLKEA